MLTTTTKKQPYLRIALFGITLLAIGVVGWWFFTQKLMGQKVVTESSSINLTQRGTLSINHGTSTKVKREQNLQAGANETIRYTSDSTPVKKLANAAVLTWNQSGKQGITIEVRTKRDGSWTKWTPISAMDGGKDNTQQQNGRASALVLASKIDEFQYRSTLKGSKDKSSSSLSFADSDLITIDSSRGPNGNQSLPSRLISWLSPNASAAPTTPTIISRSQWGSPEPNGSTWRPEYAKLTRVIVHHTATTESSNSYADVRAIWYYHARTLGWGDIGYHYVIDSKGRIFQGRYYNQTYAKKNRVEVIGGHAYNNNVGTVGISAIGNYQNQGLSSATRESIAKMTGFKLAPYGIKPSGQRPGGGAAVVGHNAVYSTSCPGKNILAQLGTIRGIADRRYSYYRPLFDFKAMSSPRWLDLAVAAPKYNPDSGTTVSNPYPVDTRIRFVDKIERDGKTYLRTESDRNNGNFRGFLRTDTKEILPTALTRPIYLELASNQSKLSPITSQTNLSQTYPAGKIVKFVDEVIINDSNFYRSEYDKARNEMFFMPKDALRDITYKALDKPRYLRIPAGTAKVNPATGEHVGTIATKTEGLFETSVTTDKTYYRTREDSANQLPYGFSLNDLEDITYDTYTPTEANASWMKITSPVQKYNLLTRESVGSILMPEQNQSIRIADTITTNGQKYYRMYDDAKKDFDLVIPASALAEVEYEPLAEPRSMTLVRDTYKKVPHTGQAIGNRLSKGNAIVFTTKVLIGDTWFLRSEHDTTSTLNKGIERWSLR